VIEEGTLEDLARRAQRGDKDALTELVREIQHLVYRLALRFLGTPHDAEDATQEILIKVITHPSWFEGRSKLTTWVYTIASRHLMAMRRRFVESSVKGPIRSVGGSTSISRTTTGTGGALEPLERLVQGPERREAARLVPLPHPLGDREPVELGLPRPRAREPGVEDRLLDRDQPFGAGSTYRSRFRPGRRVLDASGRVLLFEPERSIGVRNRVGHLALYERFHLRPDGTGTSLSYSIRLSPANRTLRRLASPPSQWRSEIPHLRGRGT